MILPTGDFHVIFLLIKTYDCFDFDLIEQN